MEQDEDRILEIKRRILYKDYHGIIKQQISFITNELPNDINICYYFAKALDYYYRYDYFNQYNYILSIRNLKLLKYELENYFTNKQYLTKSIDILIKNIIELILC